MNCLLLFDSFFYLGKPSYKVKKQPQNKSECDIYDIPLDGGNGNNAQKDEDIHMIEEMQIEGLGDVDFGDIMSDIDISIDL